MSANANQGSGTDWKFLGLFGAYLGLFVGFAQIPYLKYEAFSRFTAWAAAAFWSLFRIPASSIDTHVRFYDFTMEIIFECTGMHYIGIFAAGVLAYPGRGISGKMLGLLSGAALILLLNVVRLGLLGLAGHFFVDLFSFLHLYLWHALFTFFVLLLWMLWVRGNMSVSWLPRRQIWTIVITGFLSFWLLWASLDLYFSFLAAIADVVFPFLDPIMPMPAAVIAEGDVIGYVSGDYVIYTKTGLYTLNLAVYAALAAAGALSSTPSLWAKRSMTGAALMIFLHLVLLFMDWTLEVTESDLANAVLRWSMVLSSMIAPVVCWLCSILVFPSADEEGKDRRDSGAPPETSAASP